MEDEQWGDRDDGLGGGAPVVVISYFDSMAQLRGQVAEQWEELSAKFADEAIAGSPDIRSTRTHLGLRVDIDSALECSVWFYPLEGGQHRHELGKRGDPLFQLSDDGGGWVDPHCLWLLVEQILDDLLPRVSPACREEIMERFDGGTRPLVLCDPTGCPLERPDSEAGAWHC